MNRQAAIVLVIRDVEGGREILTVTNRRVGMLTLPGGKVDWGETPLAAACRELHEEVNLLVEPDQLTLLVSYVNQVKGDEDREVFLYHALSAWGEPAQVEEGTKLFWRPFEQFVDESFYSAFYKKHLPAGIDHLATTKMNDGVT